MNKVAIGQSYIMPESSKTDDAWTFGGFVAYVTDILDSGMAIVEDADGDFFTIETERLTEFAD